MQKEVIVTRKGQITIPVELRRKYDIKEGSLILVEDTSEGILLKPIPRFEDLAGVDKGKYDVKELKEMLDKVREEWR